MIASCGHSVEDIDALYTLHQIHYDVNENGETVGVLSEVGCRVCFDRAIRGGYGYKTVGECWTAIEEVYND